MTSPLLSENRAIGSITITRNTVDFGGCGLPLQRFLRLVEQPRILDGDDRLVGEDLQQLDVMRLRTNRASRGLR